MIQDSSDWLLVLLGPTASGKTALSLKLAELLPVEIISADSRQVYKYLDIGTAKPDKEDLEKVRHHFISIIEPDEYFSAGLFAQQAEVVIKDIISRGKIPLVVGGSGLYIKALCEGLFDENEEFESGRLEIRKSLENRLRDEGIESLYKELLAYDPVTAAKYPDMNPRRIIRALEFFYSSGIQLSIAHSNAPPMPERKVIYFGIKMDREELYDRVNIRSEILWKKGLIGETRQVLDMGFPSDLNSLNTVGYKEAIAYLNGKLTDNSALEKMKQSTRNYAKRQMTWFKKVPGVTWISGDNSAMVRSIISLLKLI